MKYLIVVLAYVVCFGITALAVTPAQATLLPETTIFASLLYLPHGVRILATWAFGWKAIPALLLGSGVATWLFTPAGALYFLSPAIFNSTILGATVAFLAFEIARFAGFDFYWGQSKGMSWKNLLFIGALASLLNSIGQTFIYSGLIGLNQLGEVLIVFAVGDVLGLITCMFALMLGFRWTRIYRQSGR